MTATKWLYHDTVQRSTASRINHLFMTLAFAEPPSFDFLHTCGDQ